MSMSQSKSLYSRWTGETVYKIINWLAIVKNFDLYTKNIKMTALRVMYKDLKFEELGYSVQQLRNKCNFLEERYKFTRNKIETNGWGVDPLDHEEILENSTGTIKGIDFVNKYYL